MKRTFKVGSVEELQSIAKEFGKKLQPGAVVALFGDLGTGKTTFVQGLVQAFEGIPLETVSSPTFTLLHAYESSPPIYHFDLYRLEGAADFFHKGFDEYLEGEGICCIEWAEKIKDHLPANTWHVTLSYTQEMTREVQIIPFRRH